jgi:hypothetical protein
MKLKKTQMETFKRFKVETQTQAEREGEEAKKKSKGSCLQSEEIT